MPKALIYFSSGGSCCYAAGLAGRGRHFVSLLGGACELLEAVLDDKGQALMCSDECFWCS